jgi:hypothetical protein
VGHRDHGVLATHRPSIHSEMVNRFTLAIGDFSAAFLAPESTNRFASCAGHVSSLAAHGGETCGHETIAPKMCLSRSVD